MKAKSDPRALDLHRVQTWVELCRWRYGRYFAGQSRISRDLLLLEEMTEDLVRTERLLGELSVAAGDAADQQRVGVRDQILLYGRERDAIESARAEASPEALAGAMAQVANECFAAYRGRFAGKSRMSRRPGLLERIVGTLSGTLSVMQRLRDAGDQGEHGEQLLKNIEIVTANLQQYEGEVESVRGAKTSSSIGGLIEALAESANELFSEYQEHFAGQGRRDRDRDRLAQIIEGLYDAGRQMDELQRLGELQANTQNLRIVLDRARVYLREDSLIAEAQRARD